MKNKIPIISCGGGIFFTYKGEFILKKRIFEILKIDVKIILLLPDNSINNFSDYDPKIHNDNFLKKIYYNNTEHIRDTVKNRINVGIWKLPNEFKSKKLLLLENIKDINYNLELDKCINNFSNKIIAHSKKNYNIASNLINYINCKIMFPSFRKDPNNLDDYKYFLSLSKNLSLLENKLKLNNIPEYGNFQQHRI